MWSIDAGQTVNVLMYEFIDKSEGANGIGNAWASQGGYAWAVGTKVVPAGAASTLLGATALITGIISTMF